jgi:vanillate O-demethylase monooxygenase subunit
VAGHRLLPARLLREDGSDDDAFHVEIFNAITPETETTTHHFWGLARDFAVEDKELSASLLESNTAVIQEDVVALTRLEQHLAVDLAGYQELSVNLDTGGLGARRLLRRQIEQAQLQEAHR